MKKGWRVEIYNRSGLSTVDKIEIPGTPKEIDTDYRGNILVCLENRGEKAHTVEKGDKIAQIGVACSYLIDFIITEKINRHETSQGTGFSKALNANSPSQKRKMAAHHFLVLATINYRPVPILQPSISNFNIRGNLCNYSSPKYQPSIFMIFKCKSCRCYLLDISPITFTCKFFFNTITFHI